MLIFVYLTNFPVCVRIKVDKENFFGLKYIDVNNILNTFKKV